MTTAPRDLLTPLEREPIAFAAGPWSAEIRGGEVDDIRFRGRLVARSIRFVVRDADWGTVPRSVVGVDTTDHGLVLHGHSAGDGPEVAWRLEIGAGDTVFEARVDASIESPFDRNRIGLVLLHPTGVAGSSLRVIHPDGTETATEFPVAIAPHQPAHDIAALEWSTQGVAARAVFAGDVFEMEDQRNWTDASFKTYSTPLSRPFPVAVRVGETISQSIRLECRAGDEGATTDGGRPALRLGATLTGQTMPRITALASSVHTGTPSPAAGLVVEVDPQRPGWRELLAGARADAGERPLDVRIVVGAAAELAPVVAVLTEWSVPPASVAAFDRVDHVATPDLLDALAVAVPVVPVLGGVRAHFTELNREQARIASWRGPLTFSMTPTMHDLSGHQLVEALDVQRDVVRDARSIADGRPLRIGPITLRARFNAVATSEAGLAAEPATDDRQGADSLAAWVVASVAALAGDGVESLCYFEERGPRAASGAAAVALGWLVALEGRDLVDVSIGEPLAAIGVDAGDEIVVLVANPTDTDVALPAIPGLRSAVDARGATLETGGELSVGAGAAVSLVVAR
ncbi:hypothetical protein MN032_07835 [Agromyces atrinae]|uniref:hypothetical protein n=1 Tax=Agromyces atrinae TaxID=592376 RepID=UPI001F57EB23|nr:hypothetical protein [Agromyces atrinae]MCI2957598.1 hypothetical protein [Agromyces atrinae]